VSGQGIALGRIPMIAEHLRDGRLVSPFPRRYDSARGYFAIAAPAAAERPDVSAFMQWLDDEARVERTAMQDARDASQRARPRAATSGPGAAPQRSAPRRRRRAP
jgi:hypothetical protein